jgi:hypothetical protein
MVSTSGNESAQPLYDILVVPKNGQKIAYINLPSLILSLWVMQLYNNPA